MCFGDVLCCSACIALPGSDAMLFWPLATSTNSAKKGLAQQAAVTAKATPIGSHADTKGTPTKKTGTPSKYMTPTRYSPPPTPQQLDNKGGRARGAFILLSFFSFLSGSCLSVIL